MKKMVKKLSALLMAVIMVLAMSATAFAAVDWKITIKGTGIENADVQYGQIIEADPTSTLGWKFVNNDIARKFVSGWNSVDNGTLNADGVIAAMIAENMLENPANAHVSAGTINPSENFGAALAQVTEYAITPMNVATGATVTGKQGLYIITASREGYDYLPMAAYMSVAGEHVEVTAKGSENQLYKTVAENGKSVAPGDEIIYTITEQYLYFAPNAQNKEFKITDKLTNGTIKEGSIIVSIEGVDSLVADKDYNLTADGNDGFTVDFGSCYNAQYAGKKVTISYTAIAGAVTTEEPLSNSAHSSNGTGEIVNVKPVSFTVVKVDKDNSKLKLEGAEFTIYKDVAEETENAHRLTFEDKTTAWGVEVATITTDIDGNATINNLDAQVTYYVKETKAPNGYSLNDFAYKLQGATALEDTKETQDIDNVTYTVITHNFNNFNQQIVKDTKSSSLPSTGGIGTTIFTIGGCVIMIVAAGLYFSTRKKEEN